MPKIRAALYARYSSDNQRYESITGQMRCSETYCQQKGYTIVKMYTDEAKTGTQLAGRDGFNQMIEDSAFGFFDVVVFYQIDRTARNEADYYASVSKLLDNNVTYEYSADGIDIETPTGKLSEGIKVAVAAWYSRDLAIKVKRGKKETALQCKHNGGLPALGYDVDSEQKYIINDHEAIAVRQIFDMRLEGIGYGKIIDWLNAHGYKTKRGGIFGKNSLHDILKNKKYIGLYEFNKTSKKNSRIPTSDYFVIEDGMPRIIDDNTFYEVQKIMKEKANGRNTAKEIYALSGLVKCACGATMYGSRVGAKDNKYSYYICSDQKYKRSNCNVPSLRKEYLENYVRSICVDYLVAHRQEILEQFGALSADKNKESHKQKLAALIAKSKIKADKLLSIYDGEDDLLLKKYHETKEQIESLEREMKQLDASYATDLTPQIVDDYLHSLVKVGTQMQPTYMRKFFSAFIEQITVDNDNIDIKTTFRISPFLVAPTGIEPVISP